MHRTSFDPSAHREDLEPPAEGEFSKELFGPHIESILERGERAIVINLTEMRWINSTAIGLLVAAFRDAKANEARMVFAGANPRISEIMKITGMGVAITSEPSAAPQMIMSSDGWASSRMSPPCIRNPPKTDTMTIKMPMIVSIVGVRALFRHLVRRPLASVHKNIGGGPHVRDAGLDSLLIGLGPMF